MYSTKATHQPKSFFHQLRPVLVVMVEPTTGTTEQISISMAPRAYIKPICIIVTTSPISPAKTTIPGDSDATPTVIIFFPKFLLSPFIDSLIIQLLISSLKMWASPAKGINKNDTPIIFAIPMTRFCSWVAPSRARASCIPAPIRQPTAVTAATGSK